MPSISAADAPLINDAEFLEELERLEQADERATDPEVDPRTEVDPFDALEHGLPMTPAAPQTDAPHDEPGLIAQPYEPFVDPLPSAEPRVSFVAVAIVLVVCLTAGAATAAFVFHDRVTQITALLQATR